ncbi:ALIX V-shaped domain binding to HIV-domain-containing protein [Melampsora americana]|nr:ALIX V-shaped domain binding to HIV-domain-containing protein [Melampsora americana]
MSNLLNCPFKFTQSIDLSQALIDFIQSHYNQDQSTHHDALKPETDLLQSFRESSINQPSSSKLLINSNSLNSILKYHAHLVYLITRFPSNIGVKFEYWAIFSTPSSLVSSLLPGELPSSLPIEHFDLHYERASTLFNIGALHTSLAIHQSRSNLDSIKLSIHHLQQASACFAHLKDHLLHSQSQDHLFSPDLSQPFKVAQEVSRLYHLSSQSMIQTSKLSSQSFQMDWEWIKHVNLKAGHFAAVAQYRKSCDDLDSNEYGIEAGRLQEAINLLKTAMGNTKSNSKIELQPYTIALKDSETFLKKLEDTYRRARKDNDLIYLQFVPPSDQLPVIKPVSMVKAILPANIGKPLEFFNDQGFGKKLLQSIIPFGVYRAVGVYEERKKDWINTKFEAVIEELDDIAVKQLQSMNLPGSLQALERPINLPPSVIRNSEEIRGQNASRAMLEMLSSVEHASVSNANLLQEIGNSLDTEAMEDERYRIEFGTQFWKLPSSSSVNAVLRRREGELRNTLVDASRSDEVVKGLYQEWAKIIELLGQDEETIIRAVPTARATLDTHDSSEPRRLRSLLDTLDDLRIERQSILSSAHRKMAKDQIREFVLSKKDVEGIEDAWEEIFEDRLVEQYGELESSLESNRNRQDELICQIEVANQAFLDSRIDDPVTKSREEILQKFDLAYYKFHEIMNTLKEGLGFHQQFEKFIIQLKDQTDRFLESRRHQEENQESRPIQAGLYDASIHGPIKFLG